MSETLFYAWQSDLPNSTNRQFIREAIDTAIAKLHAELGVEDALRADQDTQGVPGDVTVADVIFEKIDACRIFVADITTITARNVGRKTPNPNVLIEYGRASVHPGSGSVVQVFNVAFGSWENDRPFDLRHKRRPVCYELGEGHTKAERSAALNSLASELANVFRAILSVPAPTLSVPGAREFAPFREFYRNSYFAAEAQGRVAGFWFGLVPMGDPIQLERPWDRSELVNRNAAYEFSFGASPLEFETMDIQLLGKGTEKFLPIKRGGKYTVDYCYKDGFQNDLHNDIVSVYVLQDGCIEILARTNNSRSGPYLNIRWIMADIENVLQIMDRVRTTSRKLALTYAIMGELRYDEPGTQKLVPVPGGEWRLGSIQDENEHIGALVPSDPLEIGPFIVGGRETFPSVMHQIYTDIMTSVHRAPEHNLAFEFDIDADLASQSQ